MPHGLDKHAHKWPSMFSLLVLLGYLSLERFRRVADGYDPYVLNAEFGVATLNPGGPRFCSSISFLDGRVRFSPGML